MYKCFDGGNCGEGGYCDKCPAQQPASSGNSDLLCADYDYNLGSTPPEKGGETLCGKLGRKHKMKRNGAMSTVCVYAGCDARQ